MQHPGRVSFKFIDKMQLNDSVCYVKAAFPLMGKILERTEFKENSSNARKMQTVRRMYDRIDESVDPCIREEDDEERTLSQMCFKEFTTSPYEMLVLVKDFFQDIKRLLQNQETFEKDCSRVYRRACPGPKNAGSSPGEMPRLSLCPVNLCQPGGLGLACMEHLKSHVSHNTENGGTAVPPTRCMTLAVSLQLPRASVSPGQAFRESVAARVEEPCVARAVFAWRRCLAVVLVSELCHVLVPWGTLSVAVWLLQVVNNPLPSAQGTRRLGFASPHPLLVTLVLPALPAPACSLPLPCPPIFEGLFDPLARGCGEGRGQDRARAWGWGPSRLRGPEDGGGAGPSFDSGFVLGAEQRRKEPPVREGRQEPLIYITVASVVAVLLATGGLLFYKYKSRVLERPLEDGGCDPEEPERRALQGAGECSELETQDL
ncbi:CSF1 factor, partial [Pomatorhinus ruficollis]|nr:CSF1 factor [Pomatorhinus ruficollis]